MANLDPRIEEVRKQYGLEREDFWELPQKKGTWVAKHAALELAATKAGINFLAPMVLEANGTEKCVALCVTGELKDRSEWSVGEASPSNNKNSYPYAMAEKRGKDRVILKLIGLHGLAYSEDEADDFKAPASNGNGHAKPQYEDPDGQMKAWVEQQKGFVRACNTIADVQGWEEARGDALDRLKRKNLAAWNELRLVKEGRIYEINTEHTKEKV